MKSILAVTMGALLVALSQAAPADALQYAQTFVSNGGADGNECTRSSPCSSWIGAYDHTVVGGRIVALDQGDYGALYIDKSITLDGGGVRPSSSTVSSPIIRVADVPAKVVIRGLDFDGEREISAGSVDNVGVQIDSARIVRIENCRFTDFGRAAIRSAPSNSPSRLTVLDTVLADNGGNGLSVSAAQSGLSNSNNRVTLRNVSILGNGASGIGVDATGAFGVSLNVFNSEIADNAVDGIRSNGARSKVRISFTDITGNLGQGLRTLNGGSILSFGNNRITDNAVDGAPTGMLSAK